MDPFLYLFDDYIWYLRTVNNGQPVSKILIDGGAAFNIMLYVMYPKLGKGDQDLTKTDMMLKDFEGNVSLAQGVVCVELTIGCKSLPTTFFIINGRGAYNLLLGREWIHANYCVPSTMHQCHVQWVGDKIEVIPRDSSYIIASAESDTYERIKCLLEEAWEKDFLKVADYEIPPIQVVHSDEEFY